MLPLTFGGCSEGSEAFAFSLYIYNIIIIIIIIIIITLIMFSGYVFPHGDKRVKSYGIKY